MQTDGGGTGLAVVAGDVLTLRGTGLAAAETWALLCQAAQALQDLFLSNGGVVGGSRTGPVVTPHTLELTSRGRVLLQIAPPETARAYLPPEYRPGRLYSDTDSEKMWMYSLGRALLDTTPRMTALTGTVSVSPSSALQSVLAAMTEPDPRRRASLMNLLDVISEYCRTRLQSKPFTHIVMDMYREVVQSPQYKARKRAAYLRLNTINMLNTLNTLNTPHEVAHYSETNYPCHRPQQDYQEHIQYSALPFKTHRQSVDQRLPSQFELEQHRQQQDRLFQPIQQSQQSECSSSQYSHPHHHYHHHNQYRDQQQHQQQQQQYQESQPASYSKSRHHGPYHKGTLFKFQSRNSRSHPNLTSLCEQQQQQQQQQQRLQEANLTSCRPQFQSQLDVQMNGLPLNPPIPSAHCSQRHHHTRTYSQPIYTRLQHARSSVNLPATILDERHTEENFYGDPIYALPVKPFLSSQDVRVNGLTAKSSDLRRNQDECLGTVGCRQFPGATCSQSNVMVQSNERVGETIYSRNSGRINSSLQRQHSNPQLPSREREDVDFKRFSQPSIEVMDHHGVGGSRKEKENAQQQNPVSSNRIGIIQGPPKPPRIITTLRKQQSDVETNQQEPPPKPPRNILRNGPRARRGKAVQRAPSRLYRTIGGPMRCFNKAQCVGPEFVIRANQPPKLLSVGQVKQSGNSGRIVVIMLTGQRLEVTCDPHKITAGDLFQAIVQAECLEENFTLGLAVLLAGDFAMLPPDTKLNKVAPPGWLSTGKTKGLLGLPTSFMLYLRLRFFLPSLRGMRNWISKHLLYLQIRRCILEQQLICPYGELINLTGLALQAEFGNYNVSEHGCGDYFLLEHYIPESLILSMDQRQPHANNGIETLKARLHQAHRDRRGLDSNKAEEMFVAHAQSLPDYGSHYYIATVESKELEKVMAQQQSCRKKGERRDNVKGSVSSSENIYDSHKARRYFEHDGIQLELRENLQKTSCIDERRNSFAKSLHLNGEIYGTQRSKLTKIELCNNANANSNNLNNSNNKDKGGKSKKTESNVWLAIHAQGLKLFERGGEPRERIELAQFQWRDIQTLSYSKNCLVVYSKLNGKRCKFKLRMDHRKSYFAFKLTSLHHQFFLRLRSELTSLQGLAKDFGVPTKVEPIASPSKTKSTCKTKISIANTVKPEDRETYPMQLEEYQNKENERPQKDTNALPRTREAIHEPVFYCSEDDALYAQVNVRLEPEGESRDTEDESERCPTTPSEPIVGSTKETRPKREKIYNSSRSEIETDTETYSLANILSTDNITCIEKQERPEDLYAAINKVAHTKSEFPVPEEVWDVTDVKKSINRLKASSLPNYGTPKQPTGFRTPSLPRRLGVKMGTRAIYSSLIQKDINLTDDTESVSMKSDTESSIPSLSARSAESPLPEAYVLNTDIRTNDETFHITEDESMSASLMARLEELSFAEERILQTIKLERGHGGSIGLQVTEGNDGGVYVQAVSVGGSADMAGNVNKGDRIVAINGQSLLNFGYEDALKMLQSSSEMVELVLSQATTRNKAETRQGQGQDNVKNNYLQDIRFDVSSETETSSVMSKWINQKTTDVASVQNTSSAYSSAASSAMGNHNANSLYLTDFTDVNDIKSASMLLSIEDFDVSRTSRQVFI